MTPSTKRAAGVSRFRTFRLEGDPKQQPNYLDHIPVDATLGDIRNSYEIPDFPDRMGYCAYCEGHHHKYGKSAEVFVGDTLAGVITLGGDCGYKLFGDGWTKAEHHFDDRQNRQHYQSVLTDVRPTLPDILHRMSGWQTVADRIAACQRRFRNTFPEIFDGVKAAATSGGSLIAYERVRDARAEADQDGDAKNARKMYRDIEVPIHRPSGGAFFSDLDPTRTVNRIYHKLSQTHELTGDMRLMTTAHMRNAAKTLREALNGMREFAKLRQAVDEMLDPGNLRGIANWATQTRHVPGEYGVSGRALVRREHVERMEMMPNFPILDTSAIDLLAERLK